MLRENADFADFDFVFIVLGGGEEEEDHECLGISLAELILTMRMRCEIRSLEASFVRVEETCGFGIRSKMKYCTTTSVQMKAGSQHSTGRPTVR